MGTPEWEGRGRAGQSRGVCRLGLDREEEADDARADEKEPTSDKHIPAEPPRNKATSEGIW